MKWTRCTYRQSLRNCASVGQAKRLEDEIQIIIVDQKNGNLQSTCKCYVPMQAEEVISLRLKGSSLKAVDLSTVIHNWTVKTSGGKDKYIVSHANGGNGNI